MAYKVHQRDAAGDERRRGGVAQKRQMFAREEEHFGVGEVLVIRFLAQASYHSDKDQGDEEVGAGEGRAGYESAGAGLSEWGTGVHMNARRLQAHGEIWAEKATAYLQELPGR